MNDDQLKKTSYVLLAVVIVAVLVLVIDIGIKNTILQEAEFIKHVYGETRERAAEAATPGIRSDNSNRADVLDGSAAGVEIGNVPTGGHEEAKVAFPARGANGKFVSRAPRGHSSIPPSDEQVGA
jgi:hypothetical protein